MNENHLRKLWQQAHPDLNLEHGSHARTYRPETFSDSQTISAPVQRKFRQEAQVTGFLDHPNIVPVHDLETNEQGDVQRAMKLVKGIEWSRLLKPETERELTKASQYGLKDQLNILLNVSKAIQFAHSKKIAHLDLKPENIMIGDFGEVLVMDWGLAVNFEHSANSPAPHKSTITQPCGTPSYMAPELAQGEGHRVGPWTDVYLLGAILYELLNKETVHTGKTLFKVILSAARSAPPSFVKGCPEELQDICRKSLKRDCPERYQSVEQLQKALRDYLRNSESLDLSKRARKKSQKLLRIGLLGSFSVIFIGAVTGMLYFSKLNKELEEHNTKLVKTVKEREQARKNAEKERANAEIERTSAHKAQKLAEARQRQAEEAKKTAQTAQAAQKTAQAAQKTAENASAEQKRQRLIAQQRLAAIFRGQSLQAIKKKRFLDAKVYLAHSLQLHDHPEARQKLQKPELGRATRLATSPRSKNIKQLAFSHDGQWLAAAHDEIEVWNPKTGRKEYSLGYPIHWNSKILFSHDDQSLLFQKDKHSIALWDFRTSVEALLIQRKKTIKAVGFGPTALEICIVYNNDTIEMSDRAGTSLRVFKNPRSSKYTKLFPSRDGRALLLSGNPVLRWDLSKDSQPQPVSYPRTYVKGNVMSHDGQTLIWTSDKSCVLWKIGQRESQWITAGHNSRITSFAIDPKLSLLASADDSGQIIVSDLKKERPLWSFKAHQKTIPALAMSADKKWLASAGYKGSLKLWDLSDRALSKQALGHKTSIAQLVLSPDKTHLATADKNSVICIWSVSDHKLIQRFQLAPRAVIQKMAFDPGNQWFAVQNKSGQDSYGFSLWNLTTGARRWPLGHKNPVLQLIPTKDGFISADKRELLLWTDHSARPYRRMPTSAQKTIALSRDNFHKRLHRSPNAIDLKNKRMAYVDKYSVVIDSPKGSLKIRKTTAIHSIALDPKERFVAIGVAGSSFQMHSLKDGRTLKTLRQFKEDQLDPKVTQLRFSPDGQFLMSAGSRRHRRITRMNEPVLPAQARYTDTVKLWDGLSGALLKSWKLPEEVVDIRFNSSGTRLAILCKARQPHDGRGLPLEAETRAGLLKIIPLKTLKTERDLAIKDLPFSQCLFARDDQTILALSGGQYSYQQSIRRWDLKTGRARTDAVFDFEFPAPDQLSWIGPGNQWELLDLKSNQSLQIRKDIAHGRELFTLLNTQKLISVQNGTATLFDLQENSQIGLEKQGLRLRHFAFHKESAVIAGSDLNGSIHLWNSKTGALEAKLHETDAAVKSLHFSPQQKYLLSFHSDGLFILWDLKKRQAALTKKIPEQDISGFMLDPSNRYLATINFDDDIEIFDIQRETVFLSLSTYKPKSVRFLNSTTLASAGADQCYSLWRLNFAASSQEPLENHFEHILVSGKGLIGASENKLHFQSAGARGALSVRQGISGGSSAISPDGQFLAVSILVKNRSRGASQQLDIWDLASGSKKRLWIHEKLSLSSQVIGQNNRLLAVARSSGFIEVFDIQSGQRIQRLKNISTLSKLSIYSPRYLLAATHKKNIKLWNIQTGSLIKTLKGAAKYISHIKLLNEETLVSHSSDQVIRFWDIESGLVKHQIKQAGSAIVVNHSRSQYLIFGQDKKCTLYSFPEHRPLGAFKPVAEAVTASAFSDDDKRFSIVTRQGTVQRWDLKTQTLLLSRTAPRLKDVALFFKSDDSTICRAGETIEFFDTVTGQPRPRYQGHDKPIIGLQLLASRGQFVSASQASILLWNLKSGRLLRSFGGPKHDPLTSLASSDEHSLIAAGSDSGKLLLWDLKTGQRQVLRGRRTIYQLAFDPKGQLLAFEKGGKATVWSFQGKALRSFRTGHQRASSLTFSPDGSSFVSSDSAGAVILWDSSSKVKKHELSNHIGAVYATCFSNDGALLVSAGQDKVIRLWSTQSGEFLKSIRGHNTPIKDLFICSEGSLFSSATKVLQWDLRSLLISPQELLAQTQKQCGAQIQGLKIRSVTAGRLVVPRKKKK
jgi:WD40 repeat protein/serine/threonine protein kinase